MTSDTQLDPLSLVGLDENYLDHARREYLSGVKATAVCQRYGMSLSSFRAHARAGGWRRMDQPQCEAPPEFGEYHPDDNVSFADLADQAFLNIRRALGAGRASEASTWMRVYDSLADRARSEVMAALPEIATPVLESNREPLRLTATEGANINDSNALTETPDIVSEKLDSLDSVSSESK
jgi:hypothetical protein